MMSKITFFATDQTVEVALGTTILDSAIENGLDLRHDCGGNCACTTCQVIIEAGSEILSPMDDDERSLLEANDKLMEKSRLGCQARILKEGAIRVRIAEGR